MTTFGNNIFLWDSMSKTFYIWIHEVSENMKRRWFFPTVLFVPAGCSDGLEIEINVKEINCIIDKLSKMTQLVFLVDLINDDENIEFGLD